MNRWTRYDFMNRPEMRKEVIKRKVKVYLNASTLQFRLALIQDDYKNGINPYEQILYGEVKKNEIILSDTEGK